MVNAYISGTGSYVPPRVVTNDDLVREFGVDTTHEWIVQRTGIEARRFADEGMPVTYPDPCRSAAEPATFEGHSRDSLALEVRRRRVHGDHLSILRQLVAEPHKGQGPLAIGRHYHGSAVGDHDTGLGRVAGQ